MFASESRGDDGVIPLIGQGQDQSGAPMHGQMGADHSHDDYSVLDLRGDSWIARFGGRLALLVSLDREEWESVPNRPQDIATPSLNGDRVLMVNWLDEAEKPDRPDNSTT